MKQRFSSLDVKVIAQELSHALRTLRLSNVYDLSPRIFLFKFAKTDQKLSLLVDAGFRCHLTDFVRTTASSQSAFVARLRKILPSRRVTSVVQIGTDRILEIQFSDGRYRLFIEFYAGGNIILTDGDLSILALFRIVSEGPDQEELRVGLKYSLENRQNSTGVPPLTGERVKVGLRKFLDQDTNYTTTSSKKNKLTPKDTLQKALARSLSEYPPVLLHHALQVANFDASVTLVDLLGDQAKLNELLHALEEARQISESLTESASYKGYIIAKTQRSSNLQPDDEPVDATLANKESRLMYDDFQPFRPHQFEDDPMCKILEFEGFNKTVDEFFSSMESQKLESRLTEKEAHAKKKLETAKRDREKRLGSLQEVQELNVRKARAIEVHLERVKEAISAVNALIAQSIGWPEIARLIEMEQQRNNSVANLIKLPLKLHENTVTLLLAEADFEDEEDSKGNRTGSEHSDSQDEDYKSSKSKAQTKPKDKRLAVDVDLGLSPWSNASEYYDQKKVAADKEQRTMQSSEKALKSTERKINANLKKSLTQEMEVLKPQRHAFWFERFIYFISSEGYLVLASKDAQQSEILYKKHLKKGDVYIHADLHGAANTIIKNKPGRADDPIPLSTLSQAGNLAVCTSSAWDSKAVMSAWWVRADQVSKLAPNGEYLSAGTFTISGEKQFLPPAQLLLGFGLMFMISEESKARHLKHRFNSDTNSSSEAKPDLDDTAEINNVSIENPETHPKKLKDIENEVFGAKYNTQGRHPAEAPSGSDDSEEMSRGDDEKDFNMNGLPQIDDAQRHDSIQASSHAISVSSSESLDGHTGEVADDDMVDDNHQNPDEGTEDADEIIADDAADSNRQTPGERAADSVENTAKVAPNGVRHLSARDRKIMRQSQQPQISQRNDKLIPSTTFTQRSPAPSQERSKGATPPTQVRGKKGKRNKMKTKYADQDDEDRAIAMRLLGSNAAEAKAQAVFEAKAIKEEKLNADKERRREQHVRALERGKDAEQRRRRVFEEGFEPPDDDEQDKAVDLEAFVGGPLPGDEILDALVVCGPWDAIGRQCRWKAKLQPGSLKKSKAIREILEAWNASSKAREKKSLVNHQGETKITNDEHNIMLREAELIRTIREPETIGVVPVGKVRLMMGAVEGVSKPRGGGTAKKGRRGGKGSK